MSIDVQSHADRELHTSAFLRTLYGVPEVSASLALLFVRTGSPSASNRRVRPCATERLKQACSSCRRIRLAV